MSDEERRKWLDSIVPGMEVAVTGYSYHQSDRIDVVERLTPSQIVLTSNGSRFRRNDGRYIGQTSPYVFPRLVPVDQQIREVVDRRQLNGMLHRLWKNSENIPITTVRKLLQVLEDAQQTKENA